MPRSSFCFFVLPVMVISLVETTITAHGQQQAPKVHVNEDLEFINGGRRAACPRRQCKREKKLRLRRGVRVEVVGVTEKPLGGGPVAGPPIIDYSLLITRGSRVYSLTLGSEGRTGFPSGDEIPIMSFSLASLSKEDVTGDGSDEVIVTFNEGNLWMAVCKVSKRATPRCTVPFSMGTEKEAKSLNFPGGGLVEIDGSTSRVQF